MLTQNRPNPIARIARAARIAPRIALALLTLLGALLPRSARADQAIVVGIGTYRDAKFIPTLRGARGDAERMAAALQRQGYKVVLLRDAEATKDAILAAFKALKIKRSERFIFYFAGHGSDAPRSIVPHDARPEGVPSRNTSVITRDELRAALDKVPAGTSTLLLDSCCSGGMRGTSTKNFGERYINLAGGRSEPVADAGSIFDDERIAPVAPAATAADKPKIRILTASDNRQIAREWEYKDGQFEGIFTHNLLKTIEPPPASAPDAPPRPSESESEPVLRRIRKGVEKDSEKLQQPQAIGIADGESVLGPIPAPEDDAPREPTCIVPKATLTSVWDSFYDFEVNPNFITVSLSPAKTTLAVNERFNVSITAKEDGHVLVLCREADGNITLVYPKLDGFAGIGAGVSADRCFVRAGRTQPLGRCYFDAPGIVQYKVLHITDKPMVEDFLRVFARQPKRMLTPDGARGIGIEAAADARVFTAGFSIDISATAAAADSAAPKPAAAKDAPKPAAAKDAPKPAAAKDAPKPAAAKDAPKP